MLEGISLVAGRAGAHGLVVPCPTEGVESASRLARVDTLLLVANLVGVTLVVDHALGATVWRVAEVAGLALAHLLIADDVALGVGTAG